MKRAESSDDEDDDSKQVAIVQNHMSWEEDLQLAISKLSTIKRTMPITSSAMDPEALQLEMLESCNEAILLMEQLVRQRPVACKLVHHITDLVIPLGSVLMRSEGKREHLDQWIDTIEVLFARLKHKQNDSIEAVLNAIRQLSIEMSPLIRDSIMMPMTSFLSLLHDTQCCVMLDGLCTAPIDSSLQASLDASEFATAFQSLVNALLPSPEGEEGELLPHLQTYLACLHPFFLAIPSSSSHLHSIAAFWHCQFALLAIATCFPSNLLLPLITPLSWSPSILAKIPSFYTPIDTKSFPNLLREHQQSASKEKWQSRLLLCGNLVIESMKCL